MKTIQIQNFKSIKQSPKIELKPLNIFIGQNSCGKSSFLRVFPLLKQSLEKPINDPILWFGDYVDFGSFFNSLNSSCDFDDPIVFTFGTVLYSYSLQKRSNGINVDVSLFIKEKYVDSYQFVFDGNNKITLKRDLFNDSIFRVYINDELLDKISFINKTENNNLFNFTIVEPEIIDDTYYEYYPLFRRIVFENSYKYIFDKEMRRLFFNQLNDKIQQIHYFPHNNKKFVFEEFDKIFLLKIVNSIIQSIQRALIEDFDNVQYFQPIRARADRFYRVQGININEVDSNGLNASMILYSMGLDENRAFNTWCQKNFGFSYFAKSIGDSNESASIMVKTSKGEIRNLIDVGFGYSQILPIILSIWKTYYKYKKNVSKQEITKIIVLEQPELHLHPAFQQQIMSIILKLIEQLRNRLNLIFIIETHSESIINYLGRKIALKEYFSDDLNMFALDKIDGETRFTKMIFDSDGLIDNWPIGFFDFEE